MDKLVTRKEVLETLKIHFNTLHRMVKNEKIETVKIGTGPKSLYNLEKYLRDNGVKNRDNEKRICYCRVSSKKQEEDLKRQIELMKLKFPTYEVLSDIGSGLNFNRVNLQKIIDYAVKGELVELVITYKDRLARFGYEMIENLIKKYSNGKIVVLDKTEEKTVSEEIAEDITAIMNVYVAKINGLRKYKKQIRDEIDKQEKKNKDK